MNIENLIKINTINAIKLFYDADLMEDKIQVQKTKKEYKGHITLVVYPLLQFSKKKPEDTAYDIGIFLSKYISDIEEFNIVKGFLNISIRQSYWLNALQKVATLKQYGFNSLDENQEIIMLEYSSPNTNKPLHLGHIRNNLLGFSLSKILEANGNRVIKTNIVNDRGIHICKSMYAWQQWGADITPKSANKKGDHLVGEFYVKFNKEFEKEKVKLQKTGLTKEEVEKNAQSMIAVRKMLKKWEDNDEDTRDLWKTMNTWVYEGFDETYKKLGVSFDKIYYESDTYLVGREKVMEGLKKGICYQKEDGSVWIDLTDDGLDHKILLRNDGTSVYITQDIGTAKLRYEDYGFDKMIYVVGNEQNYHFHVLAILLDKLGYRWGKDLIHFSYGMVELPEGKMKSREGTVVDADDLIDEMKTTARSMSITYGKLEGYPSDEVEKIVEIIAMGALKYFMLKVDPRKNMVFNPKESIDFNGNTGPFIQYTHARIRSVLRKAKTLKIKIDLPVTFNNEISEKALQLIQKILDFPSLVIQAGNELSPALIANYCYELAKEYNQFYHDFSILGANDQQIITFRLLLSRQTAVVLKKGMSLLGIEVPERM